MKVKSKLSDTANNYLKHTKKQKGITLIALVITIIVLLILAGVTIATLTGNNGILTMAHKAKEQTEEAKIDEEYKLENASEIIGGSAEKVKRYPKEYYGKIITNYNGYEKDNSKYNWQIFYSDGNNIYITTTDYIMAEDCPSGKSSITNPTKHTNYQISFTGILSDYNKGSEDITDERIIPWLKFLKIGKYNKYNMQSTAYLLDTSVWSKNFKGTNADYAIGAPTLDMFVASYKDTHANKYVEFNLEDYGYTIKWNTDTDYGVSAEGMQQNELNSLYIISDTTKCNAQWLASPSSYGVTGGYMMYLHSNGLLGGRTYFNSLYVGIRPVVCLSKGVILEEDGNGYKIR